MSTVATIGGTPFLLERTEDPATEPVSVAEMKTHLRAYTSVTDTDSLLSALITAAREWAEQRTGRALIEQTWRVTVQPQRSPGQFYPLIPPVSPSIADGWLWWCQSGEILLRRSPVIAIESFVSVDGVGAETTIGASSYVLCDAGTKRPRLAAPNGVSWGSAALVVEFRAGFLQAGSPTIGAVPKRFLQAIKLHVEANYDRDEKTMQLYLDAAEALLEPERADLGMA